MHGALEGAYVNSNTNKGKYSDLPALCNTLQHATTRCNTLHTRTSKCRYVSATVEFVHETHCNTTYTAHATHCNTACTHLQVQIHISKGGVARMQRTATRCNILHTHTCGCKYMSAKVESRAFSIAHRSFSRCLTRVLLGSASNTARPSRTPSVKSS